MALSDIAVRTAKPRAKARELLAAGKDPSREKQQARHRAIASAANTFGDIAINANEESVAAPPP